jgi:hypothetical protein
MLKIRLNGHGEVDRLDVRIALCSIIDNILSIIEYAKINGKNWNLTWNSWPLAVQKVLMLKGNESVTAETLLKTLP